MATVIKGIVLLMNVLVAAFGVLLFVNTTLATDILDKHQLAVFVFGSMSILNAAAAVVVISRDIRRTHQRQ